MRALLLQFHPKKEKRRWQFSNCKTFETKLPTLKLLPALAIITWWNQILRFGHRFLNIKKWWFRFVPYCGHGYFSLTQISARLWGLCACQQAKGSEVSDSSSIARLLFWVDIFFQSSFHPESKVEVDILWWILFPLSATRRVGTVRSVFDGFRDFEAETRFYHHYFCALTTLTFSSRRMEERLEGEEEVNAVIVLSESTIFLDSNAFSTTLNECSFCRWVCQSTGAKNAR